jgi:outer membrane protein
MTRALLAAAALATLAAASGPACAQLSLNDIMPNFVGLGVGVAPEHVGANRYTWGVAPGGRVALGGERFVSLTGPAAEVNLLNSRWLQAGPVAIYRFGRSDAGASAVRRLGDLDPAFELGGRVGVSYVGMVGQVPLRLRAGVAVTGDVTGQYGGAQILPSASVWVPLSPNVFVGAGAYARFGTGSANRYFFGVTPAGAQASGLPAFRPGSGASGYGVWPALVWRLNERWAVGGGALYTRVADEVGRSPIVRDRDGFVAGIGVAYTW